MSVHNKKYSRDELASHFDFEKERRQIFRVIEKVDIDPATVTSGEVMRDFESEEPYEADISPNNVFFDIRLLNKQVQPLLEKHPQAKISLEYERTSSEYARHSLVVFEKSPENDKELIRRLTQKMRDKEWAIFIENHNEDRASLHSLVDKHPGEAMAYLQRKHPEMFPDYGD